MDSSSNPLKTPALSTIDTFGTFGKLNELMVSDTCRIIVQHQHPCTSSRLSKEVCWHSIGRTCALEFRLQTGSQSGTVLMVACFFFFL